MFMPPRPVTAIVVILAAAAFSVFCLDAGAQPALRLSVGTAAGVKGETIEVPVMLSGSSNASTIVFGIAYDSQALQLVSVGEGSALEWDQYTIIIPATPGKVRITVWGNNNLIADGELCVIAFKILSSTPGVVDLDGWGQPSAASLTGTALAVVVVGGEVFINCDGLGPDAPTGVTASTGDESGVTVSWSPAVGAVEYRVYRARTSNPGDVDPVSNWMAGVTSWLDASAAGPADVMTFSCQGGGPTPVHYYYWVRARDEGGCPSDYSQPAEGWRDASDKAAVLSAALIGSPPADIALFAAAALGLSAGVAIKNRRQRKKGG
ncbi:MAG TPA: cohesin domain-containing protein [Candidatus Bathyarchaeia archaeon]|nr:cohesin domain-containing protein [Candidatus Bathyarchaeia archaeon]